MSSRTDIDVSYGVSNDFYRLWLDQRMTYTCALFDGEHDTLEDAQTRKLEHHYRAARVTPQSRVLDIGCGWGSNLEFLAKDKGVKDVVGITLSTDQLHEIVARNVKNVSVELVSYQDYRPDRPFDAVISIGMFEHVATPQEARSGQHIEKYREYFRKAWEWTRPGAWFSLQSVVGAKVPRGKALRELAWGTYTIFPGAISPRLEAILQSVSPYWEVMEVYTRREHYARTSAAWLERLQNNRETVVQQWGKELYDQYVRYLETCVMAFTEGYQSLVQLALRRIETFERIAGLKNSTRILREIEHEQ